MRLPDPPTLGAPPLAPLLKKELWEIASGRALWALLFVLCPVVGYSFFQATALYAEGSSAVDQSPLLAAGLSPLDGILVPTFGAFYVAITLLFPFVAIRALGQEKENGALRILVQLPYSSVTLAAVKLVAVLAAWLLAAVPALSALVIWISLGGHLYLPETANLLFGHLLYGIVVSAIALFAASISESAATAAILALAVTIGSWILDFGVAGRSGILDWLSHLSLTQLLRPFEQGLLPVGLVLGAIAVAGGLVGLTAIWLKPGISIREKLGWSTPWVLGAGLVLLAGAHVKATMDVTEDRRNSFATADERTLLTLTKPLVIDVHLVPEDPRYIDFQRNVLAKLERALPQLSIRLAGNWQAFLAGSADDAYGEIDYSYDGRSDASRSTSPREILPLLYKLAQTQPPTQAVQDDYPGYPLVANGQPALLWFFGVLPFLIACAWWQAGRPPRIEFSATTKEVSHARQ